MKKILVFGNNSLFDSGKRIFSLGLQIPYGIRPSGLKPPLRGLLDPFLIFVKKSRKDRVGVKAFLQPSAVKAYHPHSELSRFSDEILLSSERHPERGAESLLIVKFLWIVLFVFSLSFASAQTPPEIIYVNVNQADPAPNDAPLDGMEWNTAFNKLEDAIDEAKDLLELENGIDSVQIWVAEGIYIPGNERDDSFILTEKLEIYGGFNGTETTLEQRNVKDHVTILSGNDNNRHIIQANGLTNPAILDGFTIQAGKASSDLDFDRENRKGAGAYLFNSNMIIRNCTFKENEAREAGGAIYANGGMLSLSNCSFEMNEVNGTANNQQGGAISLQDCESIIIDCFFDGNSSVDDGGAIYMDGQESIINRSIFKDNTATSGSDAKGGAIHASSCDLELINCLITGNKSVRNGAGILVNNSNLSLTNCTVADNERNDGSDDGNGIRFEGNDATLQIHNSIIWDNGSTFKDQIDIAQENTTVNLQHSLIQGLTSASPAVDLNENNVNGNPEFLTEGIDQPYSIAGCSAARDAANVALYNSVADPAAEENEAVDVYGNPRLVNSLDIGAVEFQASPGISGDIALNGALTDASVSLCQNIPISLSIEVGNNRSAFQWFEGDIELEDEESPQLELSALNPGTYSYQVKYFDGATCDTLTSNPKVFTIEQSQLSSDTLITEPPCINTQISYTFPNDNGNTYFWSIEGGELVDESASGPSAAINWKNSEGRIIVIRNESCEFIELPIDVFDEEVSFSTFLGTDTTANSSFCQTDETLLLQAAPAGGTFRFITDNSGVVFPYDPNGETQIEIPFGQFDTLNANVKEQKIFSYEVDTAGCTLTKTYEFELKAQPLAELDVKGACFGTPTILASTNFVPGAQLIFDVDEDQVVFNTLDSIVEYTYKVERDYTPTLTVTNSLGCSDTDTDTLKVQEALTANFQVSNPCSSDTTIFSTIGALSGAGTAIWHWDFGDNSTFTDTLTDNNPEFKHKYDAERKYDVTLTLGIENSEVCSDSLTKTINILPSREVSASNPYKGVGNELSSRWISEGEQGSWEFIDRPDTLLFEGEKIWMTHPDTVPNALEAAFLTSSCFNLAEDLDRPMVSLDYWSQLAEGIDGVVLQVAAIDENGKTSTWELLGKSEDPNIQNGINWYNGSNINSEPGDEGGFEGVNPNSVAWSGLVDTVVEGRHKLDQYINQTVRFRFVFTSALIDREAAGFAIDNFRIFNRPKNRLLLEHFTQTDPVNPINQRTQDTVTRYFVQNPKDIIPINYFIDFPIDDPFHAANQGPVNARALYYKIPAPGFAILDGRANFEGDKDLEPSEGLFLDQRALDLRMLESPDYGLNMRFLAPPEVNDDLNISIQADFDPGEDTELVLQVAVLGAELSTDGRAYRNVFMDMVGGVQGQNIQLEAGTGFEQRLQLSWNAQEIYDRFKDFFPLKSDTTWHFVAFIQDYQTGEIHQGAQNSLKFRVQDLQNREGTLSPDQDFHLSLYPNPTQSVLTIDLNVPMEHELNYRMINLHGSLVMQGKLEEGGSKTQLDVNHMAEGLYYVELWDRDKRLGMKKVMILD